MTPNEALRDGFSLWLEEIVESRTKIRYGNLWVDPFATSCRNTARFAPWLVQISQAQTLDASDPTQAVVDMSAIGVVTSSGQKPTLTHMGQRVLERWSDLSLVSAKGDVAEIARCAILYREGRRATNPDVRERYKWFMRSYKRLVALQPHFYWTQDLHHLYMPMFLDQDDSRGFNPFGVLAYLCHGNIGPIEEWRDWAGRAWDGSDRLTQLLDKVGSFRPGGTRAFVRALDACLVADSQPEAFPNLLSSWGLVNV